MDHIGKKFLRATGQVKDIETVPGKLYLVLEDWEEDARAILDEDGVKNWISRYDPNWEVLEFEKVLFVNAFSINMFHTLQTYGLTFVPMSFEEASDIAQLVEVESAIGHVGTASMIANVLGVPELAEKWDNIAKARPTVQLEDGTLLIVAQYRGPRLEVGATELPKNAEIEFWQVY